RQPPDATVLLALPRRRVLVLPPPGRLAGWRTPPAEPVAPRGGEVAARRPGRPRRRRLGGLGREPAPPRPAPAGDGRGGARRTDGGAARPGTGCVARRGNKPVCAAVRAACDARVAVAAAVPRIAAVGADRALSPRARRAVARARIARHPLPPRPRRALVPPPARGRGVRPPAGRRPHARGWSRGGAARRLG